MVALADAGSRIRLALRNPMDEGTTPRHSADAGCAVFRQRTSRSADGPESARPANAAMLGSSHPIARPGAGGERRGSGRIATRSRSCVRCGGVRPTTRGAWLPSAPATRPRNWSTAWNKNRIGSGFERKAHGGRGKAHQLPRGRQALPASRAVRAGMAAHRQARPASETADRRLADSGTPRRNMKRACRTRPAFWCRAFGERSCRPELAGPAVSRPLLGTQAPGDLRFHANHPADLPGSRRAHRSGAVGAGAFLRSGFSDNLPGGRAGRADRMVRAAAHGRRGAGRGHVRAPSR